MYTYIKRVRLLIWRLNSDPVAFYSLMTPLHEELDPRSPIHSGSELAIFILVSRTNVKNVQAGMSIPCVAGR